LDFDLQKASPAAFFFVGGWESQRHLDEGKVKGIA